MSDQRAVEESPEAAQRLLNNPNINSSASPSYMEPWRCELIRADDDVIEFRFHYQSERDPTEECISWKDLDKLKREKRWSDVRRPFVLNFINERLLECTGFYTLHIVAYSTFLLLLSWHVCERTVLNNALILLLLIVFFTGMVLKFVISVERNDYSIVTLLGGGLNVLTYAATLYYIATPDYASATAEQRRFKNNAMWLCPIVAIFSAWLNILYILRRSPYGLYIFMMVRILRSFGHIAVIWIPTLLAFSFAFHLMLRDTDVEPWNASVDFFPLGDQKIKTTTNSSVLLSILTAFTKTSTMMIGEVDAKDMLGPLQWINCLLVLLFNIITVILLMNLMISLAVGDVMDLRRTAQDEILKSKLDFIIDVLIVWEALSKCACCSMCRRVTNNVLRINADGSYLTRYESLNTSTPPSPTRKTTNQKENEEDDSMLSSYAKWLIGLDWKSYLNNQELKQQFLTSAQ